jgi:hypothetical protein
MFFALAGWWKRQSDLRRAQMSIIQKIGEKQVIDRGKGTGLRDAFFEQALSQRCGMKRWRSTSVGVRF